jgi:hypothetical protein
MPRSFLIAIVYCLFWNSVSVSQVSIRSAYNESATEALAKNDYEKAERLYRLAIKEAESISIPDDTQIASILGLTNILSDTDRNPEAGKLLDRALQTLEKRVPVSETDKTFYSNLRDILASRTQVHLWNNELVEAKSNYRHWASLLDKGFDSKFEKYNFLQFLEDYSQLCEENGDFSEVEEVYKRAISVAAAQSSPKLHDVAEIKMQLAKHYSKSGQNARAEDVYKNVLEDLGNDSERFYFEITDILEALADIYQKDQRAVEAEAVLKQLLRIEETSESKLGTANAIQSLADLYIAQSKYSDAESLLQRSIALYGKTYKEYASSNIGVKLKIAKCHASQGNQEQAQKAYNDVLAVLEKRFHEKQNDFEMMSLLSEALTSVVTYYEQNDRSADVELLLNQWIERIEQSPNPDQSLRFVVLRRLADFFEAHDRGMDAETLYKKRLDKELDDSTVAHGRQRAIRGYLAMVYLRNENFENAAKEIKTLINIGDSKSRFDKRIQAMQKYVLATVLEIQDNGAEALRNEYEAIEILRKYTRVTVRVTLEREETGDTFFNAKAFREAEEHYSSAIFAALISIQDDPKVLRRLNEKLGRTVAAQKRNKEADVYFRRAQRFAEAK